MNLSGSLFTTGVIQGLISGGAFAINITLLLFWDFISAFCRLVQQQE